MSVADELAKLADLRDRGVLSDEEFGRQKAQVLGDPTIPDGGDGDVPDPSASPGWKRFERLSTETRPARFSIQGRSPRQRRTDKISTAVVILVTLPVLVFLRLACAYGFGTGGL
jgi:hypothetical protein